MRRALILFAALAGLVAPAAAQAPTDWRTPDPENVLVIETSKGRIIAELIPITAPKHVEQIKTLTRRGVYNGRKFFRVIDNFMAQTGDPTDTGEGDSDLPNLAAEFTFRRGADGWFAPAPTSAGVTGFYGVMPITTQPDGQMMITADGKVSAQPLYCPGVLGMARTDDPNSANAQFFFMRQAYPRLNGRYTAFGRVLSGLDVVRSIKTGEPVRPPQDEMTRVRLLADIPAAERPTVQVMDTRSAAFAAVVAQARASGGANFDICSVDIPARVQ